MYTHIYAYVYTCICIYIYIETGLHPNSKWLCAHSKVNVRVHVTKFIRASRCESVQRPLDTLDDGCKQSDQLVDLADHFQRDAKRMVDGPKGLFMVRG